MSVNHARRLQSIRTPEAARPPRDSERMQALIDARLRIAEHLAVYDAHGVIGEQDLLGHKWAIEAAIEEADQQLFRTEWENWLRRDIDLLHGPYEHGEHCYVCAANSAA